MKLYTKLFSLFFFLFIFNPTSTMDFDDELSSEYESFTNFDTDSFTDSDTSIINSDDEFSTDSEEALQKSFSMFEPVNNSGEDCVICLDLINLDGFLLKPCQHIFHRDCILRSLQETDPRCPTCRETPTNIPQLSEWRDRIFAQRRQEELEQGRYALEQMVNDLLQNDPRLRALQQHLPASNHEQLRQHVAQSIIANQQEIARQAQERQRHEAWVRGLQNNSSRNHERQRHIVQNQTSDMSQTTNNSPTYSISPLIHNEPLSEPTVIVSPAQRAPRNASNASPNRSLQKTQQNSKIAKIGIPTGLIVLLYALYAYSDSINVYLFGEETSLEAELDPQKLDQN